MRGILDPPSIENKNSFEEDGMDERGSYRDSMIYTFPMLKEKIANFFPPLNPSDIGVLELNSRSKLFTLRRAILNEDAVPQAHRTTLDNLDLTKEMRLVDKLMSKRLTVVADRLNPYQALTIEDGRENRLIVEVGKLAANLFFARDLETHLRQLENPLPYAFDVLDDLRISHSDNYDVGTRQAFEGFKSQAYWTLGRTSVLGFVNRKLDPSPKLA